MPNLPHRKLGYWVDAQQFIQADAASRRGLIQALGFTGKNMALNEEQQNAVMEVFRIQQREDRAAIDRTNSRMRPRTKEYSRGFVAGFLLFGAISVVAAYLLGATKFWISIALPSALVGGALAGWLADKRRKA